MSASRLFWAIAAVMSVMAAGCGRNTLTVGRESPSNEPANGGNDEAGAAGEAGAGDGAALTDRAGPRDADRGPVDGSMIDEAAMFADAPTIDAPFALDGALATDAAADAPVCEPNACGGCGLLAGAPGEACGRCGTWACSDDQASVDCKDPGDIVQISAGGFHVCVLFRYGGVRCWGVNQNGQLGDGTTDPRFSAAIPDVPLGGKATAIDAGFLHTCVLLESGGVRCWGGNANGQLGDGTTTDRATPPTTDVLTGVQSISAGEFHSCALLEGGAVRCWGDNAAGQLGDGTLNNALTPAREVLENARAVSAAEQFTCTLVGSGARCWGNDYNGELGNGTDDGGISLPPPTDVLGGVRALSAKYTHVCALMDANGGVRCWGRGDSGQLGDGSTNNRSTPPSSDVIAGATAVATGSEHTCALLSGGRIRCWGNNQLGQLGDGTTIDDPAPPGVDVLTGAVAITAGSEFTCALLDGGKVRCWGAGAGGAVGDGANVNRSSPVDVVGLCP